MRCKLRTQSQYVPWIVLVVLIASLAAVYYRYFMSDLYDFTLVDLNTSSPQCHDDAKEKTKQALEPRIHSDNIKHILWFDIYHNGNGVRNKAHAVNFSECPNNKNCKKSSFLINDSDKTVNNCEYGPFDADALVFQGVHLKSIITLPKRFSKSQIWVFAEREAHRSYSLQVAKFKSSFNWTMTYRLDSDIPMLYGKISPLPKYKTTGFVMQYGDKTFLRRDRTDEVYNLIYKNKTKTVLWLVSDCITESKRELYIKEMKPFIDVDIIGGCGQNICPKKSTKCVYDLIREYKFILSFENTFHKDYVTEKLFGWFERDIVQVVYGLANYSKITPPGSIVNAADFSSPVQLAKYLNILGNNKQAYINMLKVKSKYYATQHRAMQQNAYCKLCDMLNNVEDNRQSYPNIGSWWRNNQSLSSIPLYRQVYQAKMVRYISHLIIPVLIAILAFTLSRYLRLQRSFCKFQFSHD